MIEFTYRYFPYFLILYYFSSFLYSNLFSILYSTFSFYKYLKIKVSYLSETSDSTKNSSVLSIFSTFSKIFFRIPTGGLGMQKKIFVEFGLKSVKTFISCSRLFFYASNFLTLEIEFKSNHYWFHFISEVNVKCRSAELPLSTSPLLVRYSAPISESKLGIDCFLFLFVFVFVL